MRKIELKDFLNYKYLSDVKTNTDGSAAVFTVATCDEEKNGYNTNLYVVKEGKCTQLTNSNKDNGAFFIDKETILFKSFRDAKVQDKLKNGEDVSSFYTISLQGGEAKKLFEVPLSVSKISKLNDSTYVLQVSYDRDFSIYGRENQKEELLKAKKVEADYEVFTKIPFCHNGGGYAKNTSSRIYTYDVNTKELAMVSEDAWQISSFTLSDDYKEMLVVAHKDSKKPAMCDGIYTYHFETKTWKEILKQEEYTIDSAHYFNGGILFTGNCNAKLVHGRNENSRFYMVKDGNVSLFKDNEESLWNSVGSDCRYGGGDTMHVVNDTLYFVNTVHKDSVVRSLDKDGNIKDVLWFDGSVDCYDMTSDKMYYIAMKDGALQELYVKDKEDAKLTSLNEEVLKDKYVADYQEIKFENDGIEFTGWVLLPKDYDPNKKYPAILDIHGGPKTVYGKVFYHEMQVWANMGYFVFFTNPRGSDGRGNAFADIFGKYGTIDYDDLMKFTDTVLESYPAIDASKVGVTGGSYGGFMTNWIIGQTDRFACAATQRSISNWISFYGTSDIGMFFAYDQIRGDIFDNPAKLWEHSPLKYAKNIVTPTLFIHSDEDYRCPLEQALQLYTAMVDQGVEARFALFHGENHELSRSGKPTHRVRRLEEITNWMEKYLK